MTIDSSMGEFPDFTISDEALADLKERIAKRKATAVGNTDEPCLVCGEPMPEGETCLCLAPTVRFTFTVDVAALKAEDLPSGDEVRDGILEGLHDDWFSLNAGAEYVVLNIGNTGKVETFNH